MSHESTASESDADYVERLLNAGMEVPAGRYDLGRTVQMSSGFDSRNCPHCGSDKPSNVVAAIFRTDGGAAPVQCPDCYRMYQPSR